MPYRRLREPRLLSLEHDVLPADAEEYIPRLEAVIDDKTESIRVVTVLAPSIQGETDNKREREMEMNVLPA